MGLVADIAQSYRDIGNAQAEGAARTGQIWGGTLSNLGQQLAAMPEQQARQKLQQQELDIRQGQVDQAKRQQLANGIIAQGIQRSIKPDGSFDLSDFAAAAKDNPDVASVYPELIDRMNKTAESTLKISQTRRQIQQEEADQMGDIVAAAKTVKDPADQAAVFTKLLSHAAATGAVDPQHAAAHVADIVGADGQPDPQALQSKFAQLEQLSTQGRAARSEATKIREIPEGGSLGSAAGGIVLAGTPKLKTESELAADAANPNSPTHDQSAAAIAMLKPPKTATETAAEMDAKAQALFTKQASGQKLTPEEAAALRGYVQRKTVGPEASAAAAADRMATTQAATNARLDKTEAFQEAQTGRKELTEKIEQPYLDAREKAATLRSVIAAAKNGNMAAGNVQSLLATLGLVTMEGVKRINTTELNQVQGAGSLLERLKGSIGGIVAGKPLSPKIQQDLGELADTLETSARTKYEQGHKQITTRYGLKDEPLLAPTGASTTNPAETQSALDILKARRKAAGQ